MLRFLRAIATPAPALAPLFAVLFLLLACAYEEASAQTPVDLELVLLVDASSSVDLFEFDLQLQGIAAAFRDTAVQAAIAGAGDRGIVVSLVQWAGRNHQVVAVDWMLLYDASSAERFAAAVDAAPRYISGGSTAIGSALHFAARLLRSSAYSGTRKVIDLSGDGRSNDGRPARDGRAAALADAVTVNGLPILNEEPDLDRYYREEGIGGPGAVVIAAADFEDFARAIRAKLLRELAGPPLVYRQERVTRSATDFRPSPLPPR